VIVSLHAAVGATIGAATRSRTAALALGAVSHLVGDAVPHRDFSSRSFEAASGLAAIALLCRRRGLIDPATVGAAAATAPDIEHLLRLPRPGGSKLFHDRRGRHREGPFPAGAQLLLASALLYRLARPQAAD
jgi:hypothetical protein